MENKDEKGILIHYVNSNVLETYKSQLEKELPEFRHIFHVTSERVGYEILKEPVKWKNQDPRVI